MVIAHIYPLVGGVWPIQKFSWGHLGIIIPPPALDLWKNRDKLYWNAQVVDEIGGAVDWLAQVGSQWLKLVASNRQKTINQQGQSGLPWSTLANVKNSELVWEDDDGSSYFDKHHQQGVPTSAESWVSYPQKPGFFVKPFWRIWLSKPPDSSASMPSLCCWGCPSPWPEEKIDIKGSSNWDHQ